MSAYTNPHGLSCPWYPAAEMLGSPNIKWCEETLCQIITEPSNTWSNILFLIVSFYIYKSAKKTKQPELIWLAPAMFLMGLFSLIYHMSNNYLTQMFDFIGMYLFVFWLFVLNLRRLGAIKRENQVKLMVALSVSCTVLVHVMYLTHTKFQFIVAVAAAAIMYTEYLYFKRNRQNQNISYRNLIVGATFVAFAQISSQLDLNRVSWFCDPQNHFFQGHALWHVLGAIGLTIVYKHYEQFDYSKK
jgi:hypothetical protein